MRFENREFHQTRKISIETNVNKYAEGSCLVSFGNTKLICTASIEETVPPFLKRTNKGWVTAEYSMLPRSTHTRTKRESALGKLNGRTQEIQRLISRSLRSVINTDCFGERQILIDCDVIQADGGTRTAAITGGYVAMVLAAKKMMELGFARKNPIIGQVAAISCGIIDGNILVDLDYQEDSNAEVDANFVMNSENKIIELQGTAEKKAFSEEYFLEMLKASKNAINEIMKLQLEAINGKKV